MSRYKNINQLDITLNDLERWADCRNTSEAVALAIHAIATEQRSPQSIWAAPTDAEADNVEAAILQYAQDGELVAFGYVERIMSFQWGESEITLDSPRVDD